MKVPIKRRKGAHQRNTFTARWREMAYPGAVLAALFANKIHNNAGRSSSRPKKYSVENMVKADNASASSVPAIRQMRAGLQRASQRVIPVEKKRAAKRKKAWP